MLSNPWVLPPPGVTAGPLDAAALPQSLRDLASRKLGDSFTAGFGYISTVLIGPRSVLKFDRFPGRQGRFDHDRAVSGFQLDRVSVPQLLDEGVTDGYEWIEQTVVPGFPAHLIWHRLDEQRQRVLLAELAEAIAQLQTWPVSRELLRSDYTEWPAHVAGAVERAISRAAGIVGEESLERARSVAAVWAKLLSDGERVTCHGDLWFGNVFVDRDGRLSGLIDWDRLASAPAEYELDMLWRFWRYPWNFVPEELEPEYGREIPAGMLEPVVKACTRHGSGEPIAATLNMLELAYRLGMARRFGWGSQLQEMLDTVISGRWTDGLGLK